MFGKTRACNVTAPKYGLLDNCYVIRCGTQLNSISIENQLITRTHFKQIGTNFEEYSIYTYTLIDTSLLLDRARRGSANANVPLINKLNKKIEFF